MGWGFGPPPEKNIRHSAKPVHENGALDRGKAGRGLLAGALPRGKWLEGLRRKSEDSREGTLTPESQNRLWRVVGTAQYNGEQS